MTFTREMHFIRMKSCAQTALEINSSFPVLLLNKKIDAQNILFQKRFQRTNKCNTV